MEHKNKKLLLQDLCSRLPYGVILNCCDSIGEKLVSINENGLINHDYDIDEVKPYLFPLSSMTEEIMDEIYETSGVYNICIDSSVHIEVGTTFKDLTKIFDVLNKHHFDYRGLISMGLANDATGLNIY